MTALVEPAVEPALDVRTFLLGERGVEGLRESLREVGDLFEGGSPIQGAARRLVDEHLGEVAAGFLDVDLGAAVVAGWRRHAQLVQAARETVATPGLTEIVELARHRITTTWRPRVELMLGPASLATIAFELVVSFEIVGLHACVTQGRVFRVGGGQGSVRAALSVGGRCLLEREAPFDARLSVPLGPGMPLLGPPETPAVPSVVPGQPTRSG